ncbi:MAG TPA: type I 3-dehydroquinate dehydratase [Candidatus Methylacidiphilales bacterium]|jgi:3-dehydroquinate dehydratase-1|nr:type I 3-dehydroquinate dehydratase [Candidatus Methylacidiphilales bacterium]
MKFPQTHPVLLGTVMTAAGLLCLARKKIPADAVEIRVDALLAKKVPVEKIEAALRAKKHPVLLTLRIPSEGGRIAWKAKQRRELFLRLLPNVEAVDVELASARAMRPVIEQARRSGKTVVLSAHAIQKPASPAQIARWIARFDLLTPAILKIAVRIVSWRDLQRLAALLLNHPDSPIAVMGLGPCASQSRAVLTALGSRLIYGYLDQPAAPGQPSAAEVKKMVPQRGDSTPAQGKCSGKSRP